MVETSRSRGSSWTGILSFGFFLLLVGAIWIATSNFTEEVTNFVNDFNLAKIGENLFFPAPVHSHPVFFTAAMQFCFIFGAFQIIILGLKFAFQEPIDKKADTASGIAFWFSAGYFLNMLANDAIGWFGLLAGLIICVGLSIIASSFVKLFR